ncbi:MAG: methyl-accepting chemotaxis protein [Nitrospirae bacterium]|nr:methyl-accepting chemotaxis protein [Nitrospirota bacterium]MBF0534993.1 methyl-accepting chemotaxis protein [Nitrospirota bacterium]MBF0617155.1 methyl-accepting chemotaxis protein [Nitrospirota bacterium]
MKKFVSIKTKILLSIAIVISISGTIFLINNYLKNQQSVIENAQSAFDVFQKVYKNELETKTKDLSMSMEILLLNHDIVSAFAKGDRDALAKLTVDYFKKDLKPQYSVKQFQFHSPQAKSFFRVHKPEKFDDDLSSFRHTVVAANNTKKPVVGLEAGREGLGLRIVYPVFSDGNHVGSVEFGGDLDAILETAQNASLVAYAVSVKSAIFKESKRFEDKDKDLEKDGLTFFLYSEPQVRDMILKLDIQRAGKISKLDGKTIFFKSFTFKDYSGNDIGEILVIKDVSQIVSAIHKEILIQAAFIVIAMVITVLILYMIMLKVFIRPLNTAVTAINRLSEGNLTINVNYDNNDEVGALTHSMNNMIERLNHDMRNVSDASHNMASASDKLNESSTEIKNHIKEQTKRTSLVMESTNELSESAGQIGSSAREIADSASQTLKIATSGGDIVNKTVSEMQCIEATVVESSQVMSTLGDRSKQIGEIISVINDIADQTNLLALNAAIEAARAGEHGRGFAVVADEVRKLAEKTSKATTEIGSMISSIQTETEKAVFSMQESLNRVTAGVNLSKEAGESLQHIVQSVGELDSKVNYILDFTPKMSSLADTIISDMGEIVGISAQTASMADGLSDASNNLRTLSQNLNNVVGQFILKQTIHTPMDTTFQKRIGNN